MIALLLILFVVLAVLIGHWTINQVRTGDEGWRIVGIVAVAAAVYDVLVWLWLL